MRLSLLLWVAIMLSNGLFSQKRVNDFKYVIIPDKFEFLKANDEYQLNSLSKFLFNKYGFTAFLMSDQKPDDANDRCKALYMEVLDSSGFIRTNLEVQLKDCNGNEVFKSMKGWSKSKDYKKAHQEALRKAFNTIKLLNYSYTGKTDASGDVSKKEVTRSEPIVNNTTAVLKPSLQKETVKKKKQYLYEDKEFDLRKTSFGFELLAMNGVEGKLYASSKDNLFIMHLKEKQGIAFFSKSGDLVFEYLVASNDKVVQQVFAKR